MEDEELILTPKLLLKEFLNHQGISPDQLVIPPRAAVAFQSEMSSTFNFLMQGKTIRGLVVSDI